MLFHVIFDVNVRSTRITEVSALANIAASASNMHAACPRSIATWRHVVESFEGSSHQQKGGTAFNSS